MIDNFNDIIFFFKISFLKLVFGIYLTQHGYKIKSTDSTESTKLLQELIKCNLNSVFDLVSQHNGLFSGYIMYIVRCDCHTAIHIKHRTRTF